MKEKKAIILAAILLVLVGVYVYYSQKIEKETKPTGKRVDAAQVDPDFELKSKVAKAVRKYMQENGEAPRSFDQLKGKYLDVKTYNRAVKRNMKYTYVGPKSYRISLPSKRAPVKVAAKGSAAGTSSAAATGSKSTSKKVTTTETGWKYNPAGKPDPFKPFILASRPQEEVAPKIVRQLTPLQKMPLSEIQSGLKAIIWGQLGSKALVEDATGKGYVVQEGTYVGQHDGIVKKIYEDRIVVEEYRRDPVENRLVPSEVVLKLKKVESEQ